MRLMAYFRVMHSSFVFALLLTLSILLRYGTFFISVINHDESTYIVIAEELLRGEVYLRDVIDTKPVGIFLIYAAVIELTGGSIFSLRAAAAAVVALGAWGLWWAARRATGSERAGWAAGVLYTVACSVFTYYGVSPNTEIFFNALTITAVGLAVAPRVREGAEDPLWHWPAAGLLLGLALVIKPFAAAEALAVGLFSVWFYRRNIGRMIGAGAALVGGVAVPLAGLVLYYRSMGLWNEFLFYTFTVADAYRIELAWYLRLKYMGDYLLRYAPLVVLGAGAAWYFFAGTRVRGEGPKSGGTPRWLGYLLLQFVTVSIVILLTGKRFGHYQVQLHPVLALFAACWWVEGVRVFSWLRGGFLRRYALPIVAVGALGLGTVHYLHYKNKDDVPLLIAKYLKQHLKPKETFFCLDGPQIVHHLTNKPVPTPYVHSSLLFTKHHLKTFQIDERTEAQRIIEDPTVAYLVGHKGKPVEPSLLHDILLKEFELVDTINHLRFYRRKQ